jgi:hypothetical protein
MPNQFAELCTRIDVYLHDEGDDDGDELMELLEAAIAAHPGAASLYVARARMHDMACYVMEAAHDWEQALALAPGDRDAALQLARLRLRRPDQLAESVIRSDKAAANPVAAPVENEDDDEWDDWDEADEARAEALARQLHASGTQALRDLMRAHVADFDFVLELLDTIDELHGLSPWVHYTLLLQALAAHPGITELKTREARFLVALAGHCAIDSDETPAGYLETFFGHRYHVVTLDRAVRAIDAVTAIAADADLLSSKGELLIAMEQYQDAAAAFLHAADLFDAIADDDAAERAGHARAQANLCSQGRSALIEDQFTQMQGAMEQLSEMRRNMGSEQDDAPDDMAASLAECRAAIDARSLEITPEQLAECARVAEKLAQQTVGLISFEPIALQPMTEAGLVGGLAPWYGVITPALQAAGLSFLLQFDNPTNTRMLGMQCQGQLWTDAGAGSALVAETVRNLTLKRMLTEFDDHSFLMTADDRGKSFWEPGPSITVMSVDADTPIGDIVALHLARVARRLADTPGLGTVPIDSLERLAQAENRIRESKIDFRFHHKITESEVRGMHMYFHDEFKALLTSAIETKLAALKRPA